MASHNQHRIQHLPRRRRPAAVKTGLAGESPLVREDFVLLGEGAFTVVE
ncbi:hypothetical protein G3I59_09210 [Amycolatopsis rubida]|uniref:Uncharacterized protein n=1 Tax=Amycolatopsis rubida TaxID=112413 RepID=A0ABX0BSF4_9PSEU|nr:MULTISPECIES: hypothetical protein [Amycolatopsis]MYW90782.1 hypothetical protein [Amycolatopsis rubida]NEC55765.1 hypothetical protein [Amycolatopsis rubida]OAP26162.1 hypothetical protein A4R44_03540 [Amycolatopsis sp. M39]